MLHSWKSALVMPGARVSNLEMDLDPFAEDVAFYKTVEGGEHLKGSIQDVLDWYRDNDIAAEVRRHQDTQNRQRQLEPARLIPGSRGESPHEHAVLRAII